MSFIPADVRPSVRSLFGIYARWLARRRFQAVWIRKDYRPVKRRTIYFLNHSSWWDGLVPLLLNEYHFQQDARALMELRQMERYPFFRWLGAFSIDVEDNAHIFRAMRYAVRSMRKEGSSLYIYPQGAIRPLTVTPSFGQGLGWLHTKLPDADLVPVGIHIHTIRHNKPELHIWAGRPVQLPADAGPQLARHRCETAMAALLPRLVESAGFDNELYESFW